MTPSTTDRFRLAWAKFREGYAEPTPAPSNQQKVGLYLAGLTFGLYLAWDASKPLYEGLSRHWPPGSLEFVLTYALLLLLLASLPVFWYYHLNERTRRSFYSALGLTVIALAVTCPIWPSP